MYLIIKTVSGETFNVDVQHNFTIEMMKEYLYRNETIIIPTVRQRYIFSGRELQNKEKLFLTGLSDNDTVHLVIRDEITYWEGQIKEATDKATKTILKKQGLYEEKFNDFGEYVKELEHTIKTLKEENNNLNENISLMKEIAKIRGYSFELDTICSPKTDSTKIEKKEIPVTSNIQEATNLNNTSIADNMQEVIVENDDSLTDPWNIPEDEIDDYEAMKGTPVHTTIGHIPTPAIPIKDDYESRPYSNNNANTEKYENESKPFHCSPRMQDFLNQDESSDEQPLEGGWDNESNFNRLSDVYHSNPDITSL